MNRRVHFRVSNNCFKKKKMIMMMTNFLLIGVVNAVTLAPRPIPMQQGPIAPLILKTKYSIDAFITDANYKQIGSQAQSLIKMQLTSNCRQSAIFSEDIEEDDAPFPVPILLNFAGNPRNQFRGTVLKINSMRNRLTPPSDAELCLKNPVLGNNNAGTPDNPFKDMMRYQAQKIVSFWMDPTVTYQALKQNPDLETGRIAFGTRFEQVIQPGSQRRFQLNPMMNNPQGGQVVAIQWVSNPVAVSIQPQNGNAINVNRAVEFTLNSPVSLLPTDIYTSVLGSLRNKLISNIPQLPDDIVNHIDGFANLPQKKMYFRCNLANQLSPIQIGDMEMRVTDMYNVFDGTLCKLQLLESAEQRMSVGVHFIRKYHTTVGFLANFNPFIEFSQLRSGN